MMTTIMNMSMMYCNTHTHTHIHTRVLHHDVVEMAIAHAQHIRQHGIGCAASDVITVRRRIADGGIRQIVRQRIAR